MKKYELVPEMKKEINGITVYRIRALKDFSDVNEGDLGGYVEKEENLSQVGVCWIYDDACVYENASLYEDAKIRNDAQLLGNCHVFGDARVLDFACVFGSTTISDYAEIFDEAEVYGNATVAGNAKVYGEAKVCGKINLVDHDEVFGQAHIGCAKEPTVSPEIISKMTGIFNR